MNDTQTTTDRARRRRTRSAARTAFAAATAAAALLVAAGSAQAAPQASSGAPELGIIGGQGVPDGKYPFTAYIEARQHGTPGSCAGTLVAPDIVMSAAHCVWGGAETHTDVVVGRTVGSHKDQGQVHTIKKIVTLEGYHWGTSHTDSDYDVSFWFLDTPVTGITPARLPAIGDTGITTPGSMAKALGWGYTQDPKDPHPDRLQQVDFPIVADTVCEQDYQKTHAPFNPATNICGGEHGKSVCYGDSGGPLLRWLPGSEEPYVVGVVSRGNPSGTCDSEPAIFMSTASPAIWQDLAKTPGGQDVINALHPHSPQS